MPGIKPTTFSAKQATRLRTVRSLKLGDRHLWNRACKIWDHTIKLGPLTFCSFWSGYSFPSRPLKNSTCAPLKSNMEFAELGFVASSHEQRSETRPVGVLWPNHLCPTSSRHLCHRGNANNGVLIQVMRLWHYGKFTTNNWRNLSNQNGGIKIAFRGCQVPKSGILPQVRKNINICGSGVWNSYLCYTASLPSYS